MVVAVSLSVLALFALNHFVLFTPLLPAAVAIYVLLLVLRSTRSSVAKAPE